MGVVSTLDLAEEIGWVCPHTRRVTRLTLGLLEVAKVFIINLEHSDKFSHSLPSFSHCQ